MFSSIILLLSVALDIIFGDPEGLPHPVRYIGSIIKAYEKMIRKSGVSLKTGGFILVFFTLSTVVLSVTFLLQLANLIHPFLKTILTVYLLYTTLAAKCLADEAKKVLRAVGDMDIVKSRLSLSYLVGRDTSELSFEGVIRGVVETVAENTVDGVLAPLFYMIIGFYFNMPVQFALAYKAINTLDSMVGYIQEPYREIGYASAKLDDVANYIPARLGSILMLLAGGLLGLDINNGFKILLRDRRNHKSPNCGYPEAAVAGLLNIQLGGTNTYFGKEVYKPTIGDSTVDLRGEHIISTIKIMYMTEGVALLLGILILVGL